MVNNFVVLGIPRSGTTHVCDKLTENLNVFMSQTALYEPFNPKALPVTSSLMGNIFDQGDIVGRLARYGYREQGAEYCGYKAFPFQISNFNILEQHKSRIIIVLRKNIWKVMGSMLVGAQRQDFRTTSTTDKFTFDINDSFTRANFLTSWHNITSAYWLLENTFRNSPHFLDIMYFEDFTKQGTYDRVNEYFKYDYNFISDYSDDHHPSIYYNNWDEFVYVVKDWTAKCKRHYDALPEYVMEHILDETENTP